MDIGSKKDRLGGFRLKMMKSTYVEYQLINLHCSVCRSCGKLALWRYDKLLYPEICFEFEPNPDPPEDVKIDFSEAVSVLDRSPRSSAALLRLCVQKLCKHLGESGEDINRDIGALVKKGLDARVQKMLDSVRVIGNESVHPGTMDLRDDRKTATALFSLVNRVAYDMITHPREVQDLYNSLPESKREGIATRDKNT